jgi:hypothetical protein
MNSFRSAAAPLILLCVLLLASFAQPTHSNAYTSAARKIDWIAQNGRSANPSTRPTTLNAEEWNAYLNEGGVKVPDSVSNIRIVSDPTKVRADADVDFDRLTANRTRSNPLLALFTGKHHVTAVARALVTHGTCSVHVNSVMLDGVEVPPLALEYFSNKFLHPKYGNAVGLDASFPLGNRIDTATVGENQVTITQR